jgi:hypothetical protein
MNTEIVSRLDSSFQRENEEEMIRRAVQEGVAAAQLFDEERRAVQKGVAAAQLFDEELSHPSADKEEKSK